MVVCLCPPKVERKGMWGKRMTSGKRQVRYKPKLGLGIPQKKTAPRVREEE
jgi:hypothetical protein